ncbi:MAG: helix-turn-helix transcriptional regulator [Lachnospiraceae bacterium]|nr:helix-turn-helix transcriptional regulator [Lachnospiraceae bacterium]
MVFDIQYEDFFATRLANLREQKGVSAREMSLAIGQNESYINRIENKKTFPSMQSFFYICEYLSITPKDFFDTDTANPQLIDDIVQELHQLSDEQLRMILHIASEFKHK